VRNGRAVRTWGGIVAPLLSIIVVLVLWQLVVVVLQIPQYILPSPVAAFRAIGEDWDTISTGILVTSEEFLLGFALGSLVGFMLAVVMGQVPWLYRFLYPIMIVSQAIPVIAIGAALVIWLGFGLAPKLFIVGLIVFFPVLVNVLDGLRSVDQDSVNLARAMGASRWRTFLTVRLPATYTPLFSALKLSATFSVTGAVLAEQTASTTGGLGVYLFSMQSRFNTAGVFGAIVIFAALGLSAFLLISLWELAATPWRRHGIAPRRRRYSGKG
jgi:ABC-type nitrate/sulfonate/bicarbonate transport system permease component